jgi:hypothetical protein
MNKIRNHTKELIVLTILLAVAVSVVNAAVFVYYPISITAQWVKPNVYFAGGSNAGKTDLSESIGVNIGEDGTSLGITIHPSRRQTTYYKNVSLIVNDYDSAVYIGFNVTTPFTNIDEAYLIVRPVSGGTPLLTVNLKNSELQGWSRTIDANSKVRIDLRFKIDKGTEDSETATVQLVYSFSTESPP